ncbi:MAG: 4'-phosphopantetheinyl transferase superfamily protein [Gammaproteobacteria bacterium]|jgi:4'-phosphopantetheinyl transferase EntD|nr:4'-phosphopantetheinyl transferase superfamily protein [Gammaproteobacteria bacterium]
MSNELGHLFDDPRIHVLTAPVSDAAIGSISQREADFIAKAAIKRKREFATVRVLAREAFARHFAVCDFDFLNAPDRSPLWPAGVTGSVSHSDTRVWIAITDAALGTVGIDGESRAGLERKLWRLTLRTEEMEYLDSLPSSVQERRALTIFSAKEALYKAQYPQSGRFMGFMALRVHVHDSGALGYVFQDDVGPFPAGFSVAGRWIEETDVITSAWIPNRQAAGQ